MVHTSRRQMLGAMAVIPAIALPALPAIASTREWDRALTAYHAGEAELGRVSKLSSDAERRYFDERPEYETGSVFRVGDTTESYNARNARERADREAADIALKKRHRLAEHDAACDVAIAESCRLFDALMETPSPNLRAASVKLEIARDHNQSIDYVLDDLRRLAGEGC